MAIMDWAAWCVIAGLSFVSIGGLLIWAYGEAIELRGGKGLKSPALTSRQQFTGVLIYSVVLIILGCGLLAEGTLLLSRSA